MPPAVPVIGAIAGAAASSLVGGGLLGALAGFAVTTAISAIGGRALGKKPKAQSFSQEATGRSTIIRSSVESHKVVYGQAKVSGPLAYVETTDSAFDNFGWAVYGNNKFLHMVIPLAGHECEEIGQVYVNDQAVTIDDNGWVLTAPYYNSTTSKSYVRVRKNLGAADQQADTVMTSQIVGWTVDHRLRGIAYLYVMLEYDADVFPTGIPNVSAVVKGKKVYDPRTALTAWSDNAALCIRDYLTADYGFGCEDSEVNDTYFIAAANVCDEMVDTTLLDCNVGAVDTSADTLALNVSTLPLRVGDRVTVFTSGSLPGGISALTNYFVIPVTAAGSTQCLIKLASSYANAIAGSGIDITSAGSGAIVVRRNAAPRYTCDGVADTAVAPLENLAAMVSSLAGAVTYVQGKFRVHAGAYDAPSGDIPTSVLAGPVKIRARTARKELFNAVKGTYVDPNKQWQPTDFPFVTNATYEAQDNGERIYKDLELPFTTSPEAAQRIGKLVLEKARQGIVVEMQVFHHALKYAVFDTVTLTNEQLGWDEKVFRILKWSTPGTGPVSLLLQEETSASYSWTASTDAVTIDAAPDTNLPSATTVLPPGTPVVTETLYSTTEGSGVKTRATATWPASEDAFLREYQVEYKLTTDADYTFAGRTSATTMSVSDIVPGAYQVRVKAINNLGVSSPYSTVAVKSIFGLTAAPAGVQNFSLNVNGNSAHLSWDQATDADLDVKVGGWVRIRYTPETAGTSWNAAVDIGPALPGISTSAVLPLLAGTYMAKFIDSSGNASNEAATITTDAVSLVEMNVVETVTENPSFAGAKSGVVYDADLGGIKLAGATDWDDYPGNIDAWPYIDALGGVASSGTYTFAGEVDLGAVYPCRVSAALTAFGYDTGDLFDSRLGNIDTWTSFDGGGISDFTSAYWSTVTNLTVTADTEAAPDSTVTADKLTENTAVSADHLIIGSEDSLGIIGGLAVTVEAYAKPSGRNLRMELDWVGERILVDFDLTTGAVDDTTVDSDTELLDYGIEAAPNGFCRLWVTGRSLDWFNTFNYCAFILLDGSFQKFYTGDGTSGVYLWGYKAYQGSLQPADANDDVNAELFIRTTNDDPGATPAWSDWRRFFVGDYTARAFQFQARLASANTNHNVLVTAASATVDMPDRVEQHQGVVSGAGTYTATFDFPFKATPALAISPHNMGTGDYYTLSNQTASGFDIVFRNAAGSAVSKTFDHMAKGHGKQVSA